MRPLSRPPAAARERWVRRSATESAKHDIKRQIDAIKARPDGGADVLHFKAEWGEVNWANAMAKAQDGLCAWCTLRPVDGGSTGAIDHIRPRAEVTRWVAARGRESGVRRNVQQRRLLPDPPLRPGYHWLAYAPDNLAFSCERCNTGWKRTLWPVRREPSAVEWTAPAENIAEVELVLDPFVDQFNPFSHFRFGENGAIIPRQNDARAQATIMTFELDRPGLCADRWKLQRDLGPDCDSLRRISRNTPVEGDMWRLQRLAEGCDWRTPLAAFFRAALKHTLKGKGVPWSALRAAWDRHDLARDIAEPPDDAWIDD